MGPKLKKMTLWLFLLGSVTWLSKCDSDWNFNVSKRKPPYWWNEWYLQWKHPALCYKNILQWRLCWIGYYGRLKLSYLPLIFLHCFTQDTWVYVLCLFSQYVFGSISSHTDLSYGTQGTWWNQNQSTYVRLWSLSLYKSQHILEYKMYFSKHDLLYCQQG